MMIFRFTKTIDICKIVFVILVYRMSYAIKDGNICHLSTESSTVLSVNDLSSPLQTQNL